MPVERRLNVIQKVYETNCFTTRKPVPCRPFEKKASLPAFLKK